MVSLVERPSPFVVHEDGLLRKDQFQVAYVTNDLDRACELFKERYGIGSFDYIRGDMPQGGRIAVALAWAGSTCYEIIEAHGAEAAFYNEMLPEGEFALRFHHLGFLLHDRAAWDALGEELEAKGSRVVVKIEGNGLMDAFYVEDPVLGHYLEYIYPLQAGLDFLKNLPRS